MLTIQGMLAGERTIDEGVLAGLSDALWKLGPLEAIREQTSPELFQLFVGVQMIGNWQSEGWWGVISEQAELVPFIPQALEALGLPEVRAAFLDLVALFPAGTVFSNAEDGYADLINALQSPYGKASHPGLARMGPEERKALAAAVRRRLETLEDLTEPLWGYGAQADGWGQVLAFAAAHRG